MNCPGCGRVTPVGGIVCQYCGKKLVNSTAKTGRAMRCGKCGRRLPFTDSIIQGRTVCKECDERYARDLAEARDNEERRKSLAVSQIIARHPELRTKVMARLGLNEFSGRFHVDDGAYQDICSWDSCVTHAKNLELARRFEDSAQAYEGIGLWREAGEARERKASRTVRHVTVNLNDMIERLKDGGLAVPFKCRSCGATITIDRDSSAEDLKFCEYCGSATNTEFLQNMIQQALR